MARFASARQLKKCHPVLPMSRDQIRQTLADLRSFAPIDSHSTRQLAHLWRLRNDWQQAQRPELLAAFVYAMRKARAWNRLNIVRSPDQKGGATE